MKAKAAVTIPAGEFKTHCLRLLDDAANGQVIRVTKRGRPVAKLVPIEAERKPFRPLWGRTKGWMTIKGDIITPAVPADEWEALAD
jgi:prevent-host-death family protein